MKIAYLVYGDLNQVAGNPVHTLELTRAWVKQGHNVILIVPAFGVPVCATGARVLSVPTGRRGAAGSVVFGLLVPLVMLWLRLRGELEVVCAAQMSLSVTPALACAVLGVPHVFEIQGHLRNEICMQRPQATKERIAALAERVNCSLSRRVVTVSHGIKRYLVDTYRVPNARIVVVPNGVDVDVYRPENRTTCCRELGIPIESRVVGFVGAFYTYQRAHRLVELAPAIVQRCPLVHFVMVGDGPCLQQTKRLARRLGVADQFSFPGAVSPEVCAKFVNTFGVGVALHDPRQEGSPMKVLNYLACGKPVVATRSSGTQYLGDRNLGAVVGPHEDRETTEAILQFLETDSSADAFAKRARAEVVRQHSWEAKAQEVAATFGQLSRPGCRGRP